MCLLEATLRSNYYARIRSITNKLLVSFIDFRTLFDVLVLWEVLSQLLHQFDAIVFAAFLWQKGALDDL
jgi:hypothetical protein